MSAYHWLLVLHMIGAFATVAGIVLFTIVIAATWRAEHAGAAALVLGLSRPGVILFNAGGALVLVFGVWLAIYVDGYELWDPWILAALVLWVVSGYAGARSTAAYGEARAFAGRLAAQGADAPSAGLRELVHSRRALLLHAANAAAVLAILVRMVLKPGAS